MQSLRNFPDQFLPEITRQPETFGGALVVLAAVAVTGIVERLKGAGAQFLGIDQLDEMP